MNQTDPETGLTAIQMAYNVAQSEMFQLAAYGHHHYHPSGEALTDNGKREQRDYNNRLQKARENLESALLNLVAERAETFRGDWDIPALWLRSLADDPGALSMLAAPPDEAAAVASCPGHELSPNPCRCPCYGCKHHCAAHDPGHLDGSLNRAVAAILTDAGLRDAEGEHALAEYGRELARLVQPDGQPAPTIRATEQTEAYRLALSEALGLGTGANWEALRDRARDLAAEVAELTAATRRLAAVPAAEEQPADGMALDDEYAVDIDEEGLPFARVLFAFPASTPGEKRMALVHGITQAVHGHRFGADMAAAEEQRSDVGTEFVQQLDRLDGKALDAVEADLTAEEQPETSAEALLDTVHATATAWARPSMSEPSRISGRHLLAILNGAEEPPDNETPDDAVQLAKVVRWVTSEVVSAKTEFGDGYRAAQRDIRDLVKGRFDNDPRPAIVPQPEEARPRCPHCQMPHDLTSGSLPWTACEMTRQRITEAERLHGEGDHSLCCRADCEALRFETVHDCPPDGSGLTPCCGRTPFELPLGDRISSEAPITCHSTPSRTESSEGK